MYGEGLAHYTKSPLLPLVFLCLVSPRRVVEVRVEVWISYPAGWSMREGTGCQHTGQVDWLLDCWDQRWSLCGGEGVGVCVCILRNVHIARLHKN